MLPYVFITINLIKRFISLLFLLHTVTLSYFDYYFVSDLIECFIIFYFRMLRNTQGWHNEQISNNRPTTAKEVSKVTLTEQQKVKRRLALDDHDYICMPSEPKKTNTKFSDNVLDDKTLDDLLGDKTLDDFLAEVMLDFIFSQTIPTTQTATMTENTPTAMTAPTVTLRAGPTTDNCFNERLMSMILEGITTGHIKKQTLENNENNDPVLMLTMKKM